MRKDLAMILANHRKDLATAARGRSGHPGRRRFRAGSSAPTSADVGQAGGVEAAGAGADAEGAGADAVGVGVEAAGRTARSSGRCP
ncbi:hypothetical protein GCM10010505_46170 [Kitasatospora aburaviensis]